MKGYQQLSFKVNEMDLSGKYVPKIQVSMVKEIFVSNTTYSCSEAVAQSEIVEKELRNSDREKFICLHFNFKNQIISYEVVSMGSLNCSLARPVKTIFIQKEKSMIYLN
jgi:DNA repair protein RadC